MVHILAGRDECFLRQWGGIGTSAFDFLISLSNVVDRLFVSSESNGPALVLVALGESLGCEISDVAACNHFKRQKVLTLARIVN